VALKAVLDSLDSIDASLHDHYTEKDGKFYLQIEGIKDHPDTQALRGALERVRQEKKDLITAHDADKLRLEGLPDDFDASAYEAMKALADGKEPPKSDEQVTRVREQLERKHQAELGKKDERIAVLERQIGKVTIDDGLSKAMDEANVDPKHKAKLLPYLKAIGAIKLEETEGEFKAVVETDMGPVALGRFVTDWAGSDDGKDYVTKPSGPGGNGNNGRGGTAEVNPWAKDTFNLTKQGEIARTDPAKAQRFKAAAGAA
jgi:hypothetical protein